MPETLPIRGDSSYFTITQASSRMSLLVRRLPIIVLLLASTQLAGLDRQSPWFDEGYRLSLAQAKDFSNFLQIFSIFTTSEHLQPTYYVFIFLWSRIVGNTDAALRLPSVVFSITSGLVVYAFADHLTSRRVASLAFPFLVVTFYASSSFAFYYAQEAWPYASVQMLSFIVLALWSRDCHSVFSVSMAFTVACFFTAMASPFAALLIVSLCCTDLILDRKRWFLRWRWSSVLIGAAFLGYLLIGWALFPSFVAKNVISLRQPLWMNAAYLLYGSLFGTTLGPANSALRSVGKFHTLMAYWSTLTACAISVLALSRGLYLSLRDRSRSASLSRDLTFATTLYAILLFLIFGFAGHLNLLPRRASALFAMVFILYTSCAAPLNRYHQPSHPEKVYLRSGLIGVLALNLLSIGNYWSNPSFRKDDYRFIASVLRQDKSSLTGPAFLIAGDICIFQHYDVSLIDVSGVDPTALTQSLRRLSRDASDITLVINEHRKLRWDHIANPAQILQPNYLCKTREAFAYMEVVACRLNTPQDSHLAAFMQATIATGTYVR